MTASTIETKTPRELTDKSVIALIAGGGSLPAELADRLAENGLNTVVMPIEGEADDDARFQKHQVERILLEEFGGLITRLKRHAATHVLMAGTVKRRPRIAALRLSPGLFRALIDVAWALARGDDSLLRAVIGHVEKSGFSVISAQDVLPELLADEGVIAPARPSKRDLADISAATTAARAIGTLDIGQAAIAIGGRVVALEGIEGTDGLLARTADLRSHGRLAGARGGVLVKCSKPGQELRADLPAVGPETVDAAAKAGLAGIALEAGRSLLLEREETLRRARDRKVFIYGIEAKSS